MANLLKNKKSQLSAAMVLVAIGIVYGDIATSPMYVMKSIVNVNDGIMNISKDYIIGCLSLVIWTITLITTVKYVLIAMKVDNKGEGGIFALYSVVRKCAKWLIWPAIIGGAALLADGVLTPAVTVTNAVEGLRSIEEINTFLGPDQDSIIIIVILILAVLFLAQKAGTSIIGKTFGPLMMIWFLFLALGGITNLFDNLEVIKAINPMYALQVLTSPDNRVGIMILGSVFLATTGAEALYADMGHVGKKSIYISWPFVKVCLIINYFCQSAWLINNIGNPELADINNLNAFYMMLDPNIRMIGIILGAMAAIIASQALITGSFSVVSEAIKLDLLPRMKTYYPSETRGQIYIPLVNNLLWICTSLIVLLFQTSEQMETAYGLAITITLLMVTILLCAHMIFVRKLKILSIIFGIFFGLIEIVFFLSCIVKFFLGGYVACIIAIAISLIMIAWYAGTRVEKTQIVNYKLSDFKDKLKKLKEDKEIPKTAGNLVFITQSNEIDNIEADIMYSILDKETKRADAYYFVNFEVTDQPYGSQYHIENFGTDYIFRIVIRLGWKEDHRLNVYMRKIFNDLLSSGELPAQMPKHTSISNEAREKLKRNRPINLGPIKYCLINKTLIPESDLTSFEKWAVSSKYMIRSIAESPQRWYGLENSSLIIENVPLFVGMAPLDKSFTRY